jgi:hypothetical protein
MIHHVWLVCILFLRKSLASLAQTGLKFTILLPPPPEQFELKHTPPHLADIETYSGKKSIIVI